MLGTQVREEIDNVSQVAAREDWISQLGTQFTVHRSFSWIVLLLHAGLILTLKKAGAPQGLLLWLIVLIGATILSGVGMAWFAVPPFLQPIHLLLATVCFGIQFLLLLKLKKESSFVKELK